MQPNCEIRGVKLSTTAAALGFAAFALFTILLTWMPGCSPPPAVGTAPKPLAGVTLRIAVPADPMVRALIDRHGRVWSDRSGGTLEFVAADAAADLRIFAPRDFGRLHQRLAPLDLTPLKSQDDYRYPLLLRHQTEGTMDWGGRAFALPIVGESLFLVYRSDLLADPRHAAQLDARFRERFRRAPRPGGPATWQELELVAAYFAQEPVWGSGPQQAVPRPSLPPLPAAADEFDRDFHAVAASFARRAVNQERTAALDEKGRTELFFRYHFDPETGAAAITRPGFVAALDFLRRIQPFRAPGSAEQPLAAFRDGKAVAAFATLADLAGLRETGNAIGGRFGIARVPGSDTTYDIDRGSMQPVSEAAGNLVPYLGLGGWLGGIDAAAAKPDVAFDLLIFLSSPPISSEIVCEPAWGAGPTRLSHIDNRAGWHNYGLDPAATAQLAAALDGYYRAPMLNPAFRLRIASAPAYERAFADHVRSALTEGKPAPTALRAAADAWDRLHPDRAAFLREYRMSLGLRTAAN